MLPAVVLNHQIAVAVLVKPLVHGRQNIGERIDVELDRQVLAEERLKLLLPIRHENADFLKISLRNGFYEGRIHSEVKVAEVGRSVQT